jgi:hypothetical protein
MNQASGDPNSIVCANGKLLRGGGCALPLSACHCSPQPSFVPLSRQLAVIAASRPPEYTCRTSKMVLWAVLAAVLHVRDSDVAVLTVDGVDLSTGMLPLPRRTSSRAGCARKLASFPLAQRATARKRDRTGAFRYDGCENPQAAYAAGACAHGYKSETVGLYATIKKTTKPLRPRTTMFGS